MKEGNLICLDAKVGIDDNSLYRHPDLLALRDLSQSDAREAEAEKYQLNYVALEGDIGCNGQWRRACYGHNGYREIIWW